MSRAKVEWLECTACGFRLGDDEISNPNLFDCCEASRKSKHVVHIMSRPKEAPIEPTTFAHWLSPAETRKADQLLAELRRMRAALPYDHLRAAFDSIFPGLDGPSE